MTDQRATAVMEASTQTLEGLMNRVADVRVAMVTTVDERGTLSARPLTVQCIDDSGDVLFIVDRHAEWLTAGVDAMNVALVVEGDTWISIAGRGQINDDRSLLDDLWDPMNVAYFPDGKDSGVPVVLVVQADRWEYWTSPNKVAQLAELVKATFKGTKPELGDSGTIDT
jgi:general stress protein 26